MADTSDPSPHESTIEQIKEACARRLSATRAVPDNSPWNDTI